MTTAALRLVVADDDRVLLTMLVALLRDLGFEVAATATDGYQAIEAVRREMPDLVMMDLRMPVMSGTEAAMELRREFPRLPVVLLSAYDDASLQKAARDAGVLFYLVKGCSAVEIAAAIDAAMDAGAVRPECN